jgi:hypothetical protein
VSKIREPGDPITSPWVWAAAIFTLAFLPRLLIGVTAPLAFGDAGVYLTVANNILLNHCVSISDPTTGACVPHWGGNQLPGYPAFIALVQGIFSDRPVVVPVAQATVVAFVIAYFFVTVSRCTGARTPTLIAAAVLSLSPVGIGWTRLTFTESLSIAATIWITTELICSLCQKKLRVLPLALALSAAIFVRYDAVLLAIPIALVGFAIHGPVEAIRRGVILAVLVSIPLGAWWVRSVQAGLPAIPVFNAAKEGWQPATGYVSWWSTWVWNQYQYPAVAFPAATGLYDTIVIPESAYADEAEQQAVENLLAELATHVGQPFPKHIDDQFAELASARRAEEPFRQWIGLPLIRAAVMWGNPFDSSGWPVQVDTQTYDTVQGGGLLNTISQNFLAVMVKGGVGLYRVVLLVVALVALVIAFRQPFTWRRWMILAAVAYAVARTAMFSKMGLVETRYLASAYPMLEIATVAVLADWISDRKPRASRLGRSRTSRK